MTKLWQCPVCEYRSAQPENATHQELQNLDLYVLSSTRPPIPRLTLFSRIFPRTSHIRRSQAGAQYQVISSWTMSLKSFHNPRKTMPPYPKRLIDVLAFLWLDPNTEKVLGDLWTMLLDQLSTEADTFAISITPLYSALRSLSIRMFNNSFCLSCTLANPGPR